MAEMRRGNLIYAQVGAEAAPPYSTFTVLLLLSGNEVGAALSAVAAPPRRRRHRFLGVREAPEVVVTCAWLRYGCAQVAPSGRS